VDVHPLVNDADRDELTGHRRPAQLHQPRKVDPVAVRSSESFQTVQALFRSMWTISATASHVLATIEKCRYRKEKIETAKRLGRTIL
jgi:hypothetical protein